MSPSGRPDSSSCQSSSTSSISLSLIVPVFFSVRKTRPFQDALKCFDGLHIYAKVGEEVADKSEMLTPGSQEHKSTITSRSKNETQLRCVRPNPESPEISAHCLIRDLGGACQANPGSGRYRRNKTPSATPYCELYCTLCV